MRDNRTITYKVFLLVAFPLLVLILLMAVVAWIQARNREAADASLRSKQVISEAYQLTTLMNEIQAASRGFVITGDDIFRTTFANAMAAYPAQAEKVVTLVQDTPSQQQVVRRIDDKARAAQAFYNRTVELVADGKRDQAVALVRSGGGQRLMNDLRADMGRFLATEEQLDAERTRDLYAGWRRAAWLIGLGGPLAVLVSVLSAYAVSRSIIAQLNTAIQEVQSAATELQAVANQQASNAQEQAAATSEVGSTVQELLATSRQIAESAQHVAAVADSASASATAGDEAVRVVQTALGQITHQVDVIVDHMMDLGRKSMRVSSINEIITELAEQTNILAINATIEAAGAGEAGRRFGAVADEIRKLADRVGSETREIRSLIEEIRSAITTTVLATEEGTKVVATGTRQFDQVTETFKHIESQVGETAEAAREIDLSTNQQASAVEQLNLAIRNVSQAAREYEGSSRQTLQTSSRLADLSRDLARVVRRQAA
jgi:CHASE3 domain sensor protein/uncharacterized coiled-coil DUF342 family protein